jgi:hypothetical protein
MVYYHLNNKHRNRDRILKAVKEKKQIKYKVKPMKVAADFSTETQKQEVHGVRYFGH